MERKNFLMSLGMMQLASFSKININRPLNSLQKKDGGCPLKLSLNAYSFNRQLLDGTMTLDDLVNFCADHELPAVDITGYYFKGYPEVPKDEEIFYIKRKAFIKGVEISGTGVRNDFTQADSRKREEDVSHIKSWIDVAAKLGAPLIRIFTGNRSPDEQSRREVESWVVKAVAECVEYGKQKGIIVCIQNHWDFIKTADEALRIINLVNSEWFGLMLDIGSFRQGDPYDEILKTVKYAHSWQIKEYVYADQKAEKVDLIKLFRIIKDSGYRGYLPLEILEGNPYIRVPEFINQAKDALKSV